MWEPRAPLILLKSIVHEGCDKGHIYLQPEHAIFFKSLVTIISFLYRNLYYIIITEHI